MCYFCGSCWVLFDIYTVQHALVYSGARPYVKRMEVPVGTTRRPETSQTEISLNAGTYL